MKRINLSAVFLAFFVMGSVSAFAQSPATTPREALVTGDRVNVRGIAKLTSEVVAQLHTGEIVTIFETVSEIVDDPSKPIHWTKIQLPKDGSAWISERYVDKDNGTVLPNRLNVRGGPSEAYNVLGRVEHGTKVEVLEYKDGWVSIVPPTGIYGYVSSEYLQIKATGETPTPFAIATPIIDDVDDEIGLPAALVAAEEVEQSAFEDNVRATEPAPLDEVNLDDEAAIETEVYFTEVTEVPPGDTLIIAPIGDAEVQTFDSPVVAPNMEPLNDEKPRRIVRREGIVGGTFSIQAPSFFRLKNLENGRTMNYITTSDLTLNLEDIKGRHVILRGEEFIDKRWPKMPVLRIERIEELK